MQSSSVPLLEAKSIKVHFPVRTGLFQKTKGIVKAVDGVDLSVAAGETLAIVGESGSGKSTLGRALLRLGPVTEGSLRWEGSVDVLALDPKALRNFRRQAQMVFQDPYASLNPRHSAGFLLAEPLRIHGAASGMELKEHVKRLLESVGLSAADAGKIVETLPASKLFTNPRHPYTRALLDSMPSRVPADQPLRGIPGQVPDPKHPPSGCRFHPRCIRVLAKCSQEEPAWINEVACHNPCPVEN